MPSPSSQNLRSAPQKHPKPKIAVSEPSGYGPLSGRPLTKWRDAVGIGSLRPGSAAAALGISSFFLNVNILTFLVDLAVDRVSHISSGGRFRMPVGITARPWERGRPAPLPPPTGGDHKGRPYTPVPRRGDPCGRPGQRAGRPRSRVSRSEPASDHSR